MLRRPRLSYANVTATLALCLALTSPAWAGPVANSAASLKETAKKALGLGKKANKTAKRANKTANAAKATAAQALAKGGPPGAQGSTGPTGPAGPTGPTGPQGQPGPSRGNFNQCATSTPSTTANGSGGGQETNPAVTCEVAINAPSAGKLLVSASSQMEHQETTNCPGLTLGNENTLKQGLHVDGPVVASNRDEIGSQLGAHQASISGGANVAAGPHTVTYAMIVRYGGTCANNTVLDYRFFLPNVSVTFVEGPG